MAERTPAQLGHITLHVISNMPSPTALQERRDDPLLADASLGREIKRVHFVQGMIRGIPHHTLEHVDDGSSADWRRAANKVSVSLMRQRYMKEGRAEIRHSITFAAPKH